jgi:hypothetical protein
MAAVSAAAGSAPAADAQNQANAPVVWSLKAEERFIDFWGAEFLRIKQGNFRPHNWKTVTKEVNEGQEEGEPHFTEKQCKTKIDSLKKRYTAEFSKKTSTGSVNSSWVHFERIGAYLKKLPKIAGIPGAVDSGARIPSAEEGKQETEELSEEEVATNEQEINGNKAEELPHSEGNQTQPSSAAKPPNKPQSSNKNKRKSVEEGHAEDDCVELSPISKFEQKVGVIGQLNSKRKVKASPGSAVARSIDNFTKMWAGMAAKALEVEEKIAKDKADTNLQMLDMKLKYQTELMKLQKKMQDANDEGEPLLDLDLDLFYFEFNQ